MFNSNMCVKMPRIIILKIKIKCIKYNLVVGGEQNVNKKQNAITPPYKSKKVDRQQEKKSIINQKNKMQCQI